MNSCRGGARARATLDVRAVSIACPLLLSCGGDPREPTLDEASALRVCARGITVAGIDVSYYQAAVDWEAVRAGGVDFAISRISDGTTVVDPRFDDNWPSMARAGLVRGAYQYFEPAEDARAQADLVVDKVGRLGPGDLPVALDVEVSGGASPDAIANAVSEWLARVGEGTGKSPMIYTARYFWDSRMGAVDVSSRPLWVANYGVSCPDVPDDWTSWSLWQSGTGSVSGVRGAVDLDVFDGTREELDRFAGSLPPADGGTPDDAGALPVGAAAEEDAGDPRPDAGGTGCRARP
jgi:lysozyme